MKTSQQRSCTLEMLASASLFEDVIQKSKNTGAISERCQIQSGSGIRALDSQSSGARIGESYSPTVKRKYGIATSKLVAISS